MHPQFKKPIAAHESYGVTPLEHDHVDFDFDAVCEALGEKPESAREVDHKLLARALHRILHWMLSAEKSKRKDKLRAIGKRTAALAWVLHPELFAGEGGKPSLANVCQEFGFTSANLSPLTAEASRVFKVSNLYKSHDWRSKK